MMTYVNPTVDFKAPLWEGIDERLTSNKEKIDKILAIVNSGSLNRNPLPFEKTLKVIRAAKAEWLRKTADPHHYARFRLLRNLNIEERKTVTSLEPSEEVLADSLAQALQEGNWCDPILSHLRFGQYAFRAFESNAITLEQFATVFLRWEAEEQFSCPGNPLRVRPIFDNGNLSKEAKQLLLPALWEISTDELQRFLDFLADSPKSEQYFWTVKILWRDYHEGEVQKKYGPFLKQIQYVLPVFRLLEHSRAPEYKVLVVPSFSVFKAYLRAVQMEHAVDIVPEFGINSPEQIERDIPQNQRVFALNFPGVQGLEEGDSYYFGKYLASFHDFYHCYRISLIPPNHRLAYLRLSHLFNHCLELSERYPERPLLTVYWSRQTCIGKEKLGEVHIYDPVLTKERQLFKRLFCDSLIDLDGPASDGYTEPFWNRMGSNRVPYPEIARKVPFVPYKGSHTWLNSSKPNKYFDVCVALHDMVVNDQQWQIHFGIKGTDARRWDECCGGYIELQKHLIQGFQGKITIPAASTPAARL